MEFLIGAEGYLPTDPVPLTASDKEAVIVLKPAIDIRLHVIDAETGKPIPEFGVQIGTPSPAPPIFDWQPPRNEGSRGSY